MRSVRIVLLMAVVLLTAAAVMAQEKKARLNPISAAMLRMERFRTVVESLDLTADQKEKLAKIREENAPKVKEILGKVREVLTDEQRTARQEAIRTAKASEKKGAELFRAVEDAIKLTDEQREKFGKIAPDLVALNRETIKKVREILTPEQIKTLEEKMPKGGKKGAKKSET